LNVVTETPAHTASILVIDDEVQIRRLLGLTLKAHGYAVTEAETGEDGVLQAAMRHPDLIVLDLGLPDMDGSEVLRQIRAWSTIPILILSVRNDEQEKVRLLDAGADDYVTKPFSTSEFLARVRVALRHNASLGQSAVPAVFQVGGVCVDAAARTVKLHGQAVKLTTTEYKILQLFIKHAGKVLTHTHILREIWGPSYTEESQYLRVYIAQLRRKLEDNPAEPHLIVTESGVGYRLNTD
jgi:two-component system, OmpR family, KDP operon response regulator KdpE